MKRRVLAVAFAALGLATITGCRVEVDDGDSVSHQFGSDYFGAGGLLNVTDPIDGDAFMAGGQVSIAGEVKGDLVVAGGELSLGGAVGDDLYAAGGSVQLDAIVSGNARIAGGDVSVGPATVVAGALSLTGARVEFDGNTHEYLQASGGSVRINGEVHGDAQVRAEELVIGPEARIGGRLIFSGPQEPVVPDGAVISGGLEFRQKSARRFFEDAGGPVRESARTLGTVLWFLGVFVAAALFRVIFPGFSQGAAAVVGRRPLQSLGLGLAILACESFVAVVLLITVIGIPLALLLIPVYLLVMFLGWVTAALFIAQRGTEVLRPGRATSLGMQLFALLLALGALWLLRQIPLVGGLIALIALIAGIGALAWQAWNGRQALA